MKKSNPAPFGSNQKERSCKLSIKGAGSNPAPADRKLIVIAGLNASGKSALAIALAKKFDGEVISADSRQVYRGLDIGSGKIVRDRAKSSKLKAQSYLSQGIPHHLLDVANPKRTFTVAHYQKLARKAIEYVWKRGKIPILCGGTGLYIRAVVDGLVLPAVKPNTTLRKKLAKKPAAELFRMLEQRDPTRAATIDSKNPRRLIRALEIVAALGKVPDLQTEPIFANVLILGIAVEKRALEKHMQTRITQWLKRGLLKEVSRLLENGVPEKRIREFGLVYVWALKLLKNKIARSEFNAGLERDLMQYAKRQITWFKRDRRIRWIRTGEEACREVSRFVAT